MVDIGDKSSLADVYAQHKFVSKYQCSSSVSDVVTPFRPIIDSYHVAHRSPLHVVSDTHAVLLFVVTILNANTKTQRNIRC